MQHRDSVNIVFFADSLRMSGNWYLFYLFRWFCCVAKLENCCAGWLDCKNVILWSIYPRQGMRQLQFYIYLIKFFQIICSLDIDSLSQRSFEEWGGIWIWILLPRFWDPETLFCLIHFPSHIIAAVTFAFPFWPGWLLQMCHFPYTGSLLYAWPERHGQFLSHSYWVSFGSLWFPWKSDIFSNLVVSLTWWLSSFCCKIQLKFIYKFTFIYVCIWMRKKSIIRICQNIYLFFYFFGQYDLFWTTYYSRRFCFISWYNICV